MSKYTAHDLACKVDHEGGLCEAAFYYGISSDEIEDGRLKELWKQFEKMSPIVYEIDTLLNEALEKGE